jgi:hypothetical protein
LRRNQWLSESASEAKTWPVFQALSYWLSWSNNGYIPVQDLVSSIIFSLLSNKKLIFHQAQARSEPVGRRRRTCDIRNKACVVHYLQNGVPLGTHPKRPLLTLLYINTFKSCVLPIWDLEMTFFQFTQHLTLHLCYFLYQVFLRLFSNIIYSCLVVSWHDERYN